MAFELPPLPYAYDALSPYMSEETLKFHHDKHHNTYVTNLNKMVEGTDLEGKSLEEVVIAVSNDPSKQPILNQAGQHLNHSLFWPSMQPGGPGEPQGKLAEMITQSFGSLDQFKTEFKNAANGVFGSGWAWLVLKDGKLATHKTPNGNNPIGEGATPLLGVDMWEHSYYVDYRNDKGKYLDAFLNNLVNWTVVEERLSKAAA